MSKANAQSDSPSPRLRAASAMTPSGKVDDIERATIAVGVVRGLVELVSSAGVPREDFLRAAGLGPEHLNGPDDRIPYLEFNRLRELAMDMAGDDGLGLRWAASLSERMLVPISHLVGHCASLREALELLARYVHLVSNRRGYAVLQRGNSLVIQYTQLAGESLRLERFSSEMMMGGFWRFIHGFGMQVTSGPVRFAYPAPAHHPEYARLFGREVLFEQPSTELQFDQQLLDAPSSQRDDEVRDAMRDVVEKRLMRIAHGTPWAQRIAEYLVREGSPKTTDMHTTARALGVSVRTLRRRLAEEDKSYDDVLRDARCAVAKSLLRDPNRPIREVAYMLGFSDASTFHRAFKRWTDTTPTAYRASQLERPD